MLNTLNAAQDESSSMRFYLAKVVDNKDPNQKQRIRVHVPDLMVGAIETLPWLLPVTHPPFGGTAANYMTVNVPHIDSIVLVLFQDGNLSYGLYIGSVPIGSQQIGPLAENYPFRYGFVDPANNHLYVDTTEGKTDVEFRHNTGTLLHIDNGGNVRVEVVASRNTRIDIDDTMLVKGNVDTRINGNRTQSVDKDETHTVIGNETRHTEKDYRRAVNGTETVTINQDASHNYHRAKTEIVHGNTFHETKGNQANNTQGRFSQFVRDAVDIGYSNSATITITGVANINVNGNANLKVTGWLSSEAAMWVHRGPVEIQGNVAITQNLQVYQRATVNGILMAYGDVWFGSKLDVVSTINTFSVTAGMVSASGIQLHSHIHSNGNNGRPTGPPLF